MIPTKPPPSFRDIDRWSPEFIDFVSLCLVKNPEERAAASDLLLHEFVKNAKPNNILTQMIADVKEIRENQSYTRAAAIQQANKQLHSLQDESDDDNVSGTLKESPNCGTLVPSKIDNDELTMIAHTEYNTLVPDSGTMLELQSNLGTMVINSDSEESTMKRHDTNPDKPKYRPLFLEHFDKKEADNDLLSNTSNFIQSNKDIYQELPIMKVPASPHRIQKQAESGPLVNRGEKQGQKQQQSQTDCRLNQLQMSEMQYNNSAFEISNEPSKNNENSRLYANQQHLQQKQTENLIKYQRMNVFDCDYEFVSGGIILITKMIIAQKYFI